jgi:hypothetical protein
MKHFMIKYRRVNGSEEAWHAKIARFISALDGDPALAGKIKYRTLKVVDGTDYYHLAEAADEAAAKALASRDFFKLYKEETSEASGGGVEVLPLELIAETRSRVHAG